MFTGRRLFRRLSLTVYLIKIHKLCLPCIVFVNGSRKGYGQSKYRIRCRRRVILPTNKYFPTSFCVTLNLHSSSRFAIMFFSKAVLSYFGAPVQVRSFSNLTSPLSKNKQKGRFLRAPGRTLMRFRRRWSEVVQFEFQKIRFASDPWSPCTQKGRIIIRNHTKLNIEKAQNLTIYDTCIFNKYHDINTCIKCYKHIKIVTEKYQKCAHYKHIFHVTHS